MTEELHLPPIHAAAERIPPMTPEEFTALVADIAAHGQLEPCVMLGDQLLDGRNRWRACLAQTPPLVPKIRPYAGECGGSPAAFVLSQNLFRRQLTVGQKAMVAADQLPVFEAEAKARQREAGAAYGKGHPKSEVRTNSSEPSAATAPAARTAAKAAGIGETAVKTAKRLKENAPELAEEVRAGQKTLSAASRELAKQEAEEEAQTAEGALRAAGLWEEQEWSRFLRGYNRRLSAVLELARYRPEAVAEGLDRAEDGAAKWAELERIGQAFAAFVIGTLDERRRGFAVVGGHGVEETEAVGNGAGDH